MLQFLRGVEGRNASLRTEGRNVVSVSWTVAIDWPWHGVCCRKAAISNSCGPRAAKSHADAICLRVTTQTRDDAAQYHHLAPLIAPLRRTPRASSRRATTTCRTLRRSPPPLPAVEALGRLCRRWALVARGPGGGARGAARVTAGGATVAAAARHVASAANTLVTKQAEGLTLVLNEGSSTGYKGVRPKGDRFMAEIWEDGRNVSLGRYGGGRGGGGGARDTPRRRAAARPLPRPRAARRRRRRRRVRVRRRRRRPVARRWRRATGRSW